MASKFTLRPYQKEAVGSVVQHFRTRKDPALVVLPTGAGKSLVIAELCRIANGRVLVLAHVKELVEQNHGKFEALGEQGAIFSAGLSRRETQGKVVFGSVQSVSRHLDKFDKQFSLLIVDECHRISEGEKTQYQQVFRHMMQTNREVKIVGLTATPYRLGMGWIYRYHHKGTVRSTKPKFFDHCVYELPLRTLIDQQYLTPAHIVDVLAAQYDFSALEHELDGSYIESELQRLVAENKRVTPLIIQQVIEYARDRKGVMIFASSVQHAKEILGLLPKGEAALIVGDTPSEERDELIQSFKDMKIKYLVNVSVLTTGFDAPHVDLIALLRPTASVSLFQQMIGRGLRLFPDKTECLVLDYACNGFDLFAPEVGEPRPDRKSVPVEIPCPQCGHINDFWGKVGPGGELIEHYGRKCKGFAELHGEIEYCDFRFRYKVCPACGAENDISARQCHSCKQMLVDPDKKLRDALRERGTMVIRCAGIQFSRHLNKHDQPSLKVTYHGEEGGEIDEYFRLDTPKQKRAFYYYFVREHHRLPGMTFQIKSIEQIIEDAHQFRHPDFVIAKKQGKFWRIEDKIFDYKGRYRTASEAGPSS